MTTHTGIGATKTVNGEIVPDYVAEQTNNNSVIGKIINSMIERLKRHNVKGVNGVVGTYDMNVLGDAAFSIYHGSASVNVYGLGFDQQYFQVAKIL